MDLNPTCTLKTITECLNRTSKGQLNYDRNPLTPLSFVEHFKHVQSVASNSHQLTTNQTSVNRQKYGLSGETTVTAKEVQNEVKKQTNNEPRNSVKTSKGAAQDSTLTIPSPTSTLSFEMMLQVMELIEHASLNDSSSKWKKSLSFQEEENQQEEDSMKRQLLEKRLIPQSNSQLDMDLNLQKRQEAMRISQRQQEDQLESKLRDIQTLKEKEKQKLEAENRQKVLEQHRAEAHSRASACIQKFNQMWRAMVEAINGCRDKETLAPLIQTKVHHVKELKSNLDSVIKKMAEVGNPMTGITQSEEIMKEFESVSQSISQQIQEVNRKAAERDAAAQKQVSVAQPPAEPPPKETQAASLPRNEVVGKEEVEDIDFTLPQRFKLYNDLIAELHKHQIGYVNIVNAKDPQSKQFKFDCQKAVNTPVNAISPVSGSHLRDKLDKLRNLLNGQVVEVGGRRFSATQQPGGLDYVADLLARKFVRQGEDVVSSNPDSAFAIAAVIIALWGEFPKFGRLILAHFYQICPYLVPYYVPQQEGQSNQDYYKALGYQYTDGQIEKQDKFLKRMSGLVTLYAAVITASTRQNQADPYGLANGWTFMASLLNLPPRAEITATVLFHFLEVAGHSMAEAYGKQFQKLLHLLCTDYFAMIRNVTPDGCGGPVVRLDNFLQNAIKRGGIAPPSGQLPLNFW